MSIILARLKNAFAKSRFANPESATRHVSLIAGGTVIAVLVLLNLITALAMWGKTRFVLNLNYTLRRSFLLERHNRF